MSTETLVLNPGGPAVVLPPAAEKILVIKTDTDIYKAWHEIQQAALRLRQEGKNLQIAISEVMAASCESTD